MLEFFTVDAFTREPFAGNPAAVIILPPFSPDTPAITDDLRLKLAAEFNLSETAFATRLEGGSEEEPVYSLTWWTPTEEIPLCGHATLATAQIVFNQNPAALSVAFQSRKRGTLVARKNSSDSSITLDFPASSLVTLADGHKRRDKVLERVKNVVAETAIRRIDWADEIDGVVIELSPDVDLERLAFDPSVLSGIGSMVILTQPAPRDSAQDIYSRVFAPDIGVPEDPVTGAAHTALGSFWLSSPSVDRLHHSATIKETATLRAKQVSKRTGELLVRYDRQTRRVELRGWAREMMRGQINL
ncbi:hypothetical protein JCM16303_006039 [Sporobolomyces ruberrimus]